MSLNVNFFNPDALITLSGWTRQSSSNGGSKQRAQALGADGDELAYQEYGNQKSVSVYNDPEDVIDDKGDIW